MIRIASSPVSGVEIRKETVASRLAPFFRSETAIGRTPQEQSGSGPPTNAAFRIDFRLRSPSARPIRAVSTSSWTRPARKKPSRMKKPLSRTTL